MGDWLQLRLTCVAWLQETVFAMLVETTGTFQRFAVVVIRLMGAHRAGHGALRLQRGAHCRRCRMFVACFF